MGGSIIISKKVLLPLSTFGLYYLVERIRKEFDADDELFRTEIYETLDEQGMNFIVLDKQGKSGFNAFVKAARRARDKARDEDSFSSYGQLWKPLFDLLEVDPRYEEQ